MAERPLFDPPFGEARAPPLERYDWQQLERLTIRHYRDHYVRGARIYPYW